MVFSFCAVSTAINALVSAGFSVAALFERQFSDQVAMYGVARSIPIAIAVLIAVRSGSAARLLPLSFLAAAIQLCDTFVGMTAGDMQKTIGPFSLAVVTVISAVLLYKQMAENGQFAGN